MVIALHHLRDLLGASWTASVASMGTTTLAIGALVVSVFIPFVYAVLKDGFGSVRPHLTRLLGESAFVLFLWTSLYAWNVVKIIYQDHNHFVQQIQQMNIDAANAAKPVPPKLVGLGWACSHLYSLPAEVKPQTTIWMLPITVNGGSALDGFLSGFSENGNGGDKPTPLINSDWLKPIPAASRTLATFMSTSRCEVRNSGKEAFSNIDILFEIDFMLGGSKDEMSHPCPHRYGAVISEIDPGTSFTFYLVNQTAASAFVHFPPAATLETSSSPRELVALRPIGTGFDMMMLLEPTQIHWNGRPPEEKEACVKSLTAQQKR